MIFEEARIEFASKNKRKNLFEKSQQLINDARIKNFKKSIYQSLLNSNKLKSTIYINNNILYINSKDLEFVDKVFKRNLLKYKIV